jgi:hypothetical protein
VHVLLATHIEQQAEGCTRATNPVDLCPYVGHARRGPTDDDHIRAAPSEGNCGGSTDTRAPAGNNDHRAVEAPGRLPIIHG